MNRKLVLVLAACAFVGCGGEKKEASQPTQQSSPQAKLPETNPSPAVDKTPKVVFQDQVEPMTDDATRFATDLESLTTKASTFQSNFQFAEAAKAWTNVESLLKTQYGEASWQVVNARMASEVCQIESAFDASQVDQLKQIFGMQKTVGESLRSNQLEAALNLSVESTEITRSLFGDKSFMMGKQLMQLARMNQQALKNDEALGLYQQAIELLRPYLGASHPDLEIGHAYIGEIFQGRNQVAESIQHLVIATNMAKDIWGQGSLRYAARANDLGVAHYRAQQYEEAVKVLRAAEAIRREKLNAKHPQVAHSLSNLGMVYLEMGRAPMAEQCLDQAHQIFVQHYGELSGLTLDCKNKLATVKMLNGNHAEAEALLNELLTSIQDESDPRTISLLQYRLAIALSKQGKYVRAEPLFKSALQLQKSSLGLTHQATIKTMEGYALLLKQSNRQQDAAAIYAQIAELSTHEGNNTFRR